MKKAGICICMIVLAVFLGGCSVHPAKERFRAASDLLTEHQYEEAAAAFEALAESGVYTAESYRGAGIACLFRAMYPEADIAFSKARLYADESDKDFLRDVDKYLAYCRLKQGKSGEARTLYDALIADEPEADLLYLRGRILMSEGAFADASEDFAGAVAMSSDFNLYISIYELYKDYNMNADGADFLRDALMMAEQEESDHYGSGVVHYYLENYEEAKASLIAALKDNHSDARAVLLLGKTYLALDDAANARAMYKEHLSDPVCAAASYNGLAMCDLAEGNYESALHNIEEGLALHDDSVNESLLYNEIIVYEHKQDWQTARAKAATFAAMYPTNEAGQREAAFLSTR